MTAVICIDQMSAYRRVMTARDDIQRLAAMLERPGDDHLARIEGAQHTIAGALGSGESARQLGVFAERIADLTTDELGELHDETFTTAALAEVPRLASRLASRRTTCAEARASLNALAPALDRLEADRNPFAYVVRALCCALLARASHPGKDRVSRCDPQ
jgi:hypothetical protein